MTRGKASIFFYSIIGLAIIGILTKLLTNPLAIFKSLLTIVGIAVVLLAVLYFILRNINKGTNSESKKYKQAVKQSKMKYEQHDHNHKISNKKQKMNYHQKRKTKKRPSHLKLIDGKKTKDNDRANF